MPAQPGGAISAIFALFDRDHDGRLSEQEYRTFCRRLESRTLDGRRWRSHCAELGAHPSEGLSLPSFSKLYSSRCFPRHFGKELEELDALQGGHRRRSQQRRRAATAEASARRSGCRHSSGAGVQRCVPMAALPHAAAAERLLQRLAQQVGPLMRRKGWRVGQLTEFLPRNGSLEGQNFANGKEIRIRLRDSRHSGFLEYPRLVLTLLHELAHIEVSDHSGAFFDLLGDLARNCNVPGVSELYIRQRALCWTCAPCCGASAGAGAAPIVTRDQIRQLLCPKAPGAAPEPARGAHWLMRPQLDRSRRGLATR